LAQAESMPLSEDVESDVGKSRTNGFPESSSDMDSLHILPLYILPIETGALKSARMIKNVRLESVIEFFRGEQIGSGQTTIQHLPAQMGWPEGTVHADFELVRKLARLPSYDVYSLRVMLRNIGVEVDEQKYLRLSPEKVTELSSYMTKFTRPLLNQVFGDTEPDVDTFSDVVALFRDPDISKARARLEALAERLKIDLIEVPKFLEDFGDIFLSLSYYRQALDAISPTVDEFLDALIEIRKNHQLSSDRNLLDSCAEIEDALIESMASVTGRFENFDRSTDDMWLDLDAEKFAKIKELVRGFHASIGGVLCALTVKMSMWHELFPTPQHGGPVKRSEFIMSEMKQGIRKIKKIEDSAPLLASLEKKK